MTFKMSLILLASCMLLSFNSFATDLVIDREVTLSPLHRPEPTLITRAANGDFLIAGSSDSGRGYAWATRVDSTGQVIWEYLAGRKGDSDDYFRLRASFSGAIDLPNEQTLLCAVRNTSALLTRIDRGGVVLDELRLNPERPGGAVTFIRCSQWGDGFAIIGGVFLRPKENGWLVKLDAQSKVLWSRFEDYYSYGDVVETGDGGLFLISWDQQTSVIKLDSSGARIASYPLPAESSDQVIVHPLEPKLSVRVAYMMSQTRTDVVELDERLRYPKRTWRLQGTQLKAAVELTDGSIAILGSQWHNVATAALTIVDRTGNSRKFLMEPPYASPWFTAAVQSGNPNELVTIRRVGPLYKLAWISIKK